MMAKNGNPVLRMASGESCDLDKHHTIPMEFEKEADCSRAIHGKLVSESWNFTHEIIIHPRLHSLSDHLCCKMSDIVPKGIRGVDCKHIQPEICR